MVKEVTTDQPRGFVRMQIDILPETSEAMGVYCKANGMTKKGFVFKVITEYLATHSTTARKAKGRGK